MGTQLSGIWRQDGYLPEQAHLEPSWAEEEEALREVEEVVDRKALVAQDRSGAAPPGRSRSKRQEWSGRLLL